MALPMTFVIVGATGDLAHRKIFPALFAAFARGHLPDDVHFVGVARTEMDDAAFRTRLAANLKCEEIDPDACCVRGGEFLRRCHYRRCEYASASDFAGCVSWLAGIEGGDTANRILYLAVPPFVFVDAMRAMSQGGLLTRSVAEPWTRLVVEKPFGRDRASYDALQRAIHEVCQEPQTYRIDHYLGKEVVQNLLVLRFANTVFEPLWSRAHVQHVHIAWSEQQGVSGRAGYFDRYGIVRDVMQNHLVQILSLVAMERPAELHAVDIQNAKVAVLRQVRPLSVEDLLIGQYVASDSHGTDGRASLRSGASAAHPAPTGSFPRGYLEEEGVPPDSLTPTYAAAVLHVDTPRWQGVPFLLTAGKGLQSGVTEVRLHYRDAEGGLFALPEADAHPGYAANELIIRVQPDEQIMLRIVSKVPGAGMHVGTTGLDLRFREKYAGLRIADAYENLLLDVVRGDRSLFMRSDELETAWDLFTPALQALEQQRVRPEAYAFGGGGPAGLDALALRYGIADARIFEKTHAGETIRSVSALSSERE